MTDAELILVQGQGFTGCFVCFSGRHSIFILAGPRIGYDSYFVLFR